MSAQDFRRNLLATAHSAIAALAAMHGDNEYLQTLRTAVNLLGEQPVTPSIKREVPPAVIINVSKATPKVVAPVSGVKAQRKSEAEEIADAAEMFFTENDNRHVDCAAIVSALRRAGVALPDDPHKAKAKVAAIMNRRLDRFEKIERRKDSSLWRLRDGVFKARRLAA